MTVRLEPSAAGSERTSNASGHDAGEPIEGVASNASRLPPQRDVVVVEVGPRDGLQDEANSIPTSVKVAFVDALSAAGLPVIEVTSFVNPKSVPQLADAADVMTGIRRVHATRYPVLVPNQKGFERALDAGADAIALFTSATEAFARANVGASIDETFERFEPVVAGAGQRGVWVRGYVSVAFGCPYSGPVESKAAVDIAARLLELGCDEICLADTIGVATPASIREALRAARASIPFNRLALHVHDTAGTALASIEEALDHGVRTFDSAAGGLGGCPFAPGAPGNLATERLIGRLETLGLRTGVDPEAIAAALDVVRPHVPRLARITA
jgi:hydroxymethylglutaryl-CoA lyase